MILVSSVSDLIIEILLRYKQSNMYVSHIYTIVEFVLISLFFVKTISPSRLVMAIYSVLGIFLVLAFYELFSDNEDSSDELSTTAEAITFIIYSLCTFYYMLQHPEQKNIFNIPLFWLNTAILLYFSGNLFLFLFGTYLEKHYHQTFVELWGIHAVMNIIFYILITVGFWKTKAR